MDTIATLYWVPVVPNGTVAMQDAAKCPPFCPPGPNIPEDNYVGYCAVGHGIRLPGCCFGFKALLMPKVYNLANAFVLNFATPADACASFMSARGSSKPLLGRYSPPLRYSCNVFLLRW